MEEVKTRPLSDYVDKIEFSVLHFGLIKMIQNKSDKKSFSSDPSD